MRFACASLPVGKDGDIVALQHSFRCRTADGFKDSFLGHVGIKHTVFENESICATSSIISAALS